LDGYGLEAQIEKILPEMGFEPADGDRLVSAFSGWQMRMSLGKILLQNLIYCWTSQLTTWI